MSAVSLRESGKYREALAAVLPILKASRNYRPALLHFMAGDLLDDLGDYQGAVNHLQYSVNLDGSDALALNSLGFVYQKHGRHEDAVAMFTRAISVEPENTKARVNLLRSLVHLDRIEEAIRLCSDGKRIHKAEHGSEGPFAELKSSLDEIANADSSGLQPNNPAVPLYEPTAHYVCESCQSVYRPETGMTFICRDCGGVHGASDMKCPYCGNLEFLPLGVMDSAEERSVVGIANVLCPVCKRGKLGHP